jgi:hypothetical protein
MMRLNSKIEPWNRNGAGKKSAIVGGWNPPPSPVAARRAVVATVNRANPR